VSGLTEAKQMIISTQYGRLSVVLEVTAALSYSSSHAVTRLRAKPPQLSPQRYLIVYRKGYHE
jgi:hypothetical protein